MGANFITGSANTDENGHGTHCSGTIGGSTYGVYKNAKIIGVKVLDAAGQGTNAGVISGIQFVATNAPAKSVLSMVCFRNSLSQIHRPKTYQLANLAHSLWEDPLQPL